MNKNERQRHVEKIRIIIAYFSKLTIAGLLGHPYGKGRFAILSTGTRPRRRGQRDRV